MKSTMYSRIMLCFLAIPGLIGCLEYCVEHDMTVAGLFNRDVCPYRDEATREAMEGISVAPGKILPMCSLVQPQGTADVCGTDDNAYWQELQQCPVPAYIPWLCRWLGNGGACVVCLRSIEEGSCHGLFTFSVLPVTRAIVHDSDPSFPNQDLHLALRFGILCQVILVVELLVVTAPTFFLFLYLIIKLDRHIRNRNIRGRLQQLILHIYIYCGPRFLLETAMSVYVKMCGWTGRQGHVNIAGQPERMEQRLDHAPCDCDRFVGIKRSQDVDDDEANFEFVFG